MAEFVSNPVQNVASGQDVLFTEDIIECCRGNVLHRQGSGIINGEAIPTSSAIVTPAAVGDYWNVNVFAYITVPKGCCETISIQNISTQAIDVQNANIVINRTA